MPQSSRSPFASGTIGVGQIEAIYNLLAEKKFSTQTVQLNFLKIGATVADLTRPVHEWLAEQSESGGSWIIATLAQMQ